MKPEIVPLEEYSIKDSHRKCVKKYDILLKKINHKTHRENSPNERRRSMGSRSRPGAMNGIVIRFRGRIGRVVGVF